MNLLYLILVFVVVGLVLWLINSYVPMQPQIKTLMNVAVVIIMVIWLIAILFPGFMNIHVGPVR